MNLKSMLPAMAAILLGATGTAIAAGDGERHDGHGKSHAHGKHGDRGHGRHMFREGARFGARIARMADELELSEEQRGQIAQVVESTRDEAKVLVEQMRDNRRELRDASQSDVRDEVLITDLANRQGDLTAQLALIGSRSRGDVLSLLTAEQRDRLDEFRQERSDRKAERRARRDS